MWLYALWGLAGAAANRALIYLEASRRATSRPWQYPYGPGGDAYAVSVLLHCAIGAAAAWGAERTGVVSTIPLGVAVGIAAPVVLKKLAGYVVALLGSAGEQRSFGRRLLIALADAATAFRPAARQPGAAQRVEPTVDDAFTGGETATAEPAAAVEDAPRRVAPPRLSGPGVNWSDIVPILAINSRGDEVAGSATGLTNLAGLLRDLGHPTDARPLYERALSIDETAHGPNHPAVATDLTSLAGVLRDLGRAAEAKPLYERALAIDETAHGRTHPTVASDLNNLANALRDLGDAAEAKQLYERALHITEACYGEHHPIVATGLNNLAGALLELDQPIKAERLYERAVRIAETSYGPDHPAVAAKLNNLAHALRGQGRPAEAKPLFERALAITEATYGPTHRIVAIGLNNLANALRDLGQAAEARPLFERALSIEEANLAQPLHIRADAAR
ncbi:MAG TPA: tetratricopeptide repeat protein [Pseudonocardiaceae bacterium]|jgi:tetratricopeptide (TPR) repeat protein|nr:tetratricopeptide repeat protein [Pseudonocardiaceae bacterium]